jgi:DNA-directed RNA polymerase I subunit RPA1
MHYASKWTKYIMHSMMYYWFLIVSKCCPDASINLDCNTYNADYDGDEMNCHFPQSYLAAAESHFIAATDEQFIVPTDGSPLRGLIQDHVDAGVKLTQMNTFIEKEEYQQLLFAALGSLPGLELIRSAADIELMSPAIQKPKELWTGEIYFCYIVILGAL